MTRKSTKPKNAANSNPTEPDRRRALRRPVNLLIRELRPNQASRSVVSLSTSGMYIRTAVPYSEGTLAVFEIALEQKPPVVAPAWVVRRDEQKGMAFEFMARQLDLREHLET